MFNLFNAFDFLLSISMKPIFELSFMPQQLATNNASSMMHYRANISPPANLTGPSSWGGFISELFTLLVERYGVEEIRAWPIEVCVCVCVCACVCVCVSSPVR